MTGTRTYRSNKIEVRESELAGKGVFARERISKDEIVWIRSGHIVRTEEAVRLDREIGDFSVQINDDFYLCPRTKEEVADIVVHFNHSCEPNVGLDGQISYVAMRDIAPGEELTVDYAMMTSGPYRLECACGCLSCRKIVTGDDWKKPELWLRYGGYFSSYLLKKISVLRKCALKESAE